MGYKQRGKVCFLLQMEYGSNISDHNATHWRADVNRMCSAWQGDEEFCDVCQTKRSLRWRLFVFDFCFFFSVSSNSFLWFFALEKGSSWIQSAWAVFFYKTTATWIRKSISDNLLQQCIILLKLYCSVWSRLSACQQFMPLPRIR